MTQLPQQEEDLKRFILSLPPAKAAELTAKLERERVREGQGGAADRLLGALRPLLRQIKPPRWSTPMRLFCQPFEDLLINGPRKSKQPGRIQRSSVEPVWNWLAQKGMPIRHEELAQKVAETTLSREERARTKALAALHAEAAEVLVAAIEGHPTLDNQHPLARALGGADILLDAREMALVLAVAPGFMALQAKLPRPIVHLSEELLAVVRHAFDSFTAEHPPQAPYLAMAVMGRLEKPWEALALARVVARKTEDTLISATDLGMVGEALLCDLEELAGAFAGLRLDKLDACTAIALIDRFTQCSAGMTKELGIRRDGKWGARLLKARSGLSESVQALLARAPQEIGAALPMNRMGAFAKGQRKPDLSRDPDETRIANAEAWAEFVARAKTYASPAAYQAAHAQSFEAAAGHLRGYGESLLNDLKTAEGAQRGRALSYLGVCERLSRALLGDEETNLLRRRIASASAA